MAQYNQADNQDQQPPEDTQAVPLDVAPEFYAEFSKPPQNLQESQDMVENCVQRLKRRKVELDDDETSELEGEVQRMVYDWEDARTGLEVKLRDLNDLNEGVSEQTDWPWVGACSTVVPMGKIKGREITSVISRTTIRPIPFAVTNYAGPDSLYEDSKSFINELGNFVEYALKEGTNIHEMLEMSLPVTYRDGTAPLQIIWETEYEKVCDYKLYSEATEFAKDYPDADSAGISKKKWSDIVDKISQGKKYEIRYEYDVATYDAPKAYLVPLIDFVHWPIYVPEMKDLLLYGKRIWYTDYQLKQKSQMGLFEKEMIEDITKSTGDERRDTLATSRDRIEGLNRNTSAEKSKEYEVFELVYKGPVTKQDRKENIYRKYVIYYYRKTRKILRVELYSIRKGAVNYFPLRYIKRDGRLLGISLLDDIADLCLDVDTQNRQIINSRTITHVPSFKAKNTAKSSFDPSRTEFRFRPGVVYYLNDPLDVMQFDIRPVDLSGSQDNILFYMQLIDMTVGSTSGFSGQSNPIDPRAPARKQQELLRQSSNRLDDYVKPLVRDFSHIIQFMVDLYYQCAPERIKYFSKTKDGVLIEKEMERTKLFSPNANFVINGNSVFMSADMEFDRAQEIDQIIQHHPLTMQNPRVLNESLGRVLMRSRTPNYESLLPLEEEIPNRLTNTVERDIEAKAALTREKMDNRMLGDQAKRQHEKEALLIDAHTQMALDQAKQAHEAEVAKAQQQHDMAAQTADQQHQKESQLIDAVANPTPAPQGGPSAA